MLAGKLLSVNGTVLDFRVPRILKDVIHKVPNSPGFDHNFCIIRASSQVKIFNSAKQAVYLICFRNWVLWPKPITNQVVESWKYTVINLVCSSTLVTLFPKTTAAKEKEQLIENMGHSVWKLKIIRMPYIMLVFLYKMWFVADFLLFSGTFS